MTHRRWKLRFSLMTVLVVISVACLLAASPEWKSRYYLWTLARWSGVPITDPDGVRGVLGRMSDQIGAQSQVESIDALGDGRILAVVSDSGKRRLILLDARGQTVWWKKWIRYFRRSAFSEDPGFPCIALRNRFGQHIYFGVTGRKIVPVRMEAQGRAGAVWSDDVPDGWLDHLMSRNKVMNLHALTIIPSALGDDDLRVLTARVNELRNSSDEWVREGAQAAKQLIEGPSFLHLEAL